jgi:hypothetical protein
MLTILIAEVRRAAKQQLLEDLQEGYTVLETQVRTLKVDLIKTPNLIGRKQMPSTEQLTNAINGMLRRWLEPEQLPSNTTVGKHLETEWREKVQEVNHQEQ